jgi:hypothetical protein
MEQINKPILELVTKPRVHEPPIPQTMKDVVATFGKIEYRIVDKKSGSISLTNGFGIINLVTVDLPIVRGRSVHKLLVPNFIEVLTAIEKAGKASAIHHVPTGRLAFGTWAPRLKRGGKTLSMHSWGIACDINWHENPMGQIGHMDPVIVECFKAAGFAWGGDWERRDDMHFEYYKERKRKVVYEKGNEKENE